MKMKKNGWGLRVELLFIILFVVCILFAFIGLHGFGLFGGNENDDEGKVNNPDSGSNNNNNNNNNSGFNYKELEQKAADAGKQYYENNKENITDDEIVTFLALTSGGYLQTLSDEDNKECTGYVILLKNGNQVAYVNCPKYKTEGYNPDNE